MPPRRQHSRGGYCSSPYTSRSVFRDSLEYQKLQLLAEESRLRTKVHHQKTLIQLRRPYFCRMERQVGGYVLFQRRPLTLSTKIRALSMAIRESLSRAGAANSTR